MSFTDESEGEIQLWVWDLGDDSPIVVVLDAGDPNRNPQHTYLTEGTFKAKLTVLGPAGTSDVEHTIDTAGDGPIFFPPPADTPTPPPFVLPPAAAAPPTAGDIQDAPLDDAVALIEELPESDIDAAAGIFEEITVQKAVDLAEELPTEVTVSIIETVAVGRAAAIIENIDTFTAAVVLTEVSPQAAGAALELVTIDKVVAVVQVMPEVALLDRLPELSPAKLFSMPRDVLFQKLPNAPTEQLVGEVEPQPDPDLAPPTAVQETASRVAYTVPATRRGSWSTLVGSPAPIERILGRATESRNNVRVIVEDLLTRPAGTPPLPAGLKVNEMFSVNLENAEDSDFSMAHVTTFVEKSWLEQNSVHKWSIQFNRFDDDLNQWVPTPSKRVREDEKPDLLYHGGPGLLHRGNYRHDRATSTAFRRVGSRGLSSAADRLGRRDHYRVSEKQRDDPGCVSGPSLGQR